MPTWMALSFQDSTSPSMEQLLFFHDHSMIVLVLTTVLTLYLILSSLKNSHFNKFLLEGQEIETIWTIIPAILLVFIAFPSMKTLYLMEDSKNPSVTLKANGHQWYWSYEYTSLNAPEFDSFMENSMVNRLLTTSQNTYIPTNNFVRVMVSSADVIHSWAVPSMGVKVDALPGRLNQCFIMSKRSGTYTGQCSEICGAIHSFMPIVMESLPTKEFVKKLSFL